MAGQKTLQLFILFMVLILLMEEAKLIDARRVRGRKRRSNYKPKKPSITELAKKVQELEDRLAEIEECKPCENEEPQQSPKAFLFPDKKKTDYIDAGTLDKDLNALTVSLWIKTDDTSKVGYISYANKDHQNAFVLYNPNNKLALISGYYHSGDTGVTITDGIWHHVCVTLGNDAFELYFNGDLKASTTADGIFIRKGGKLIFGQDQDCVGGCFDQVQSFQGEMTGINIWDHVITKEEISALAESCTVGKGNLLNMDGLGQDQAKGGVKLIDSTCKKPQKVLINGEYAYI